MPLVKCPNCGTQVEWEGNEHRPFCSEKCKLLDLGEWIEGGYSIPDENSGLSEEDVQRIEAELNARQNDEQN